MQAYYVIYFYINMQYISWAFSEVQNISIYTLAEKLLCCRVLKCVELYKSVPKYIKLRKTVPKYA